METLLRIGLSNAVAALLLALVVVIVAYACRRPAVLHALWLLVLIKLMTPPLVWLPDPWPEAADPTPAPTAAAPAPPVDAAPTEPAPDLVTAVDPAPADAPPPADPPDVGDVVIRPPAWEAVLVPIPDAQPAATAEPPAPAATPAAPAAPWWASAAFGVWLAGALGWYGLAVVRLRRFRRLLRHAVPAPESMRQRTHRLAEKMGLRRRPAVWLVPGRLAPMLWAAGGPPRILFPADLLGQTTVEQQNALLVHELAHLRRRDHWVRWLEFAAAGLYWWNPVLWFARRELREAEEQCCDAWVTSTLPGAGKTYATALLETLDFLSDAPPAAPLLASGVGRVADLKRRLTMIMRGTTPRALSWSGLLAVVGTGALMLPLLPAWARAQPPAKEEPKKPEAAVFQFVVGAPDAPEDADKIKAELKELEALLAKKQAEAADIQAKVEAIRARLGKTTAAAPKGRVVIEAGPEVKYADVQDIIKMIQAQTQKGMDGQVIVVDKGSGKIILEMKGPNAPNPPPPPPPPGPAQFELRLTDKGKDWVVVPKSAVPPTAAPPADGDKRIDELEKKLKSILDEVEQLRKERKPGASESSNAPLHSYGPTPLEKIPYVNQLFKNQFAGEQQQAEVEARRAMLEQVVHQAEAEKARQEELTAEREKAVVVLKEVSAKENAQLDQAKAALEAAAAAAKQAEARQAQAEKQAAVNIDAEADLKKAEAELAARRADLLKARAVLTQSAQQQQAQEEETQAKLKACEAELKECQARAKKLEATIQELKKAAGEGDGPGKN